MLYKFDSPVATINLLMQCVATTSIAIIFNHTRTPYFKTSRGLRQGAPLSPLLLICMEGLSALIAQESQNGGWVTYSTKNFMDPPKHLVFADDFMLFTKATSKGLKGVKNVISTFCQMSGQNINLGKSKALLSNFLSEVFC